MSRLSRNPAKPREGQTNYVQVWLVLGSVVVSIPALLLTWAIFPSTVQDETPANRDASNLHLPAFDYQPWHALPVQQGRIKPFQTACAEAVRQVCGKANFEGRDPVAVVLSWMIGGDATPEGNGAPWETYPFLLCHHRGLRQAIYRLQANAQLEGKYVSPADVRGSRELSQLLREAARQRAEHAGKAHFHMTGEQQQAEELAQRLELFDAVCGRLSTRLYDCAIIDQKLFDERELNISDRAAADAALLLREQSLRQAPDPFHLVGLDTVPDSSWFSLTELRMTRDRPDRWQAFRADRLAHRPAEYVAPDCLRALRHVHRQIRDGQAAAVLDELKRDLAARRNGRIAEFVAAHRADDFDKANELLHDAVILAGEERAEQVRDLIQAADPRSQAGRSVAEKEMTSILTEADDNALGRLRSEIDFLRGAYLQGESPTLDAFDLEYLEARFPAAYRSSLTSNPLPLEQVETLLAAWNAVGGAYRSGDNQDFLRASQDFFDAVRETTDWTIIDGIAQRDDTASLSAALDAVQNARVAAEPQHLARAKSEFVAAALAAGHAIRLYPGTQTIPLELTYNRCEPFLWASILMLAATIALSLSIPSWSWARPVYVVGLLLFVVALLVQGLGFAARITIAGRAPVGSIYETVIWAAFALSIIALLLEGMYRRRAIALAGAGVATLALLLAYQLPVALDPSLDPLAPVLRTNYWLALHVLTIVTAYAAGTLAWGLGNLTLALVAFGWGDSSALRTLSTFTYRAMQITVVLLAAGTFLGGCWAAEAWGRFWGWDPKEVGALVALICYIAPLHARYIGWVNDFGLAVAAVVCYASVLLSWYVVNFVFAAGLHSYGFGGSEGLLWVAWASLINVLWLLIGSFLYLRRQQRTNHSGGLPEAAATT